MSEQDRFYREAASQARDIARRIGPAASPEWVREELGRLANQWEFWANQRPAADRLVHRGMGSDLMALCGAMGGISGRDQVRLSYVDDQVTCLACLRLRIRQGRGKGG